MEDFTTTGEYHESEKSSAITAITFLLVGAGIGAIAALLLAPKSGKQMRKMVRRKFEDARDAVDDLQERAGDYWDKSSDWASEQKDRVAPVIRKFRKS